ncbi:hypothetical protein BH10PSE19_BH10PSE19_06920 [soil metagenome]
MPAKKFIQDIRTFEADHGLKPSDIRVSENDEITVTLDKSVLYQYDPGQKKNLQRFWSWVNDSDNSFNPDAHARKVAGKLNQDEENDDLVRVSAKKRYKQLPIPYFSIPIPIENAGTKVREYGNLAAQKIKVSLTFPKGYSSAQAISKLIKAAMMSDTLDENPPLPNAARRVSWNPIKWFLHFISKLIPRVCAQQINKILPNKWIKATRPYEWGTKFCDTEINHGFINSGALASLINPVIGAPTVWLGTIVCDGENEVGPYRGGSNDFGYGTGHTAQAWPYSVVERDEISYYYTNRMSLFAQTRAKLTPVGRGVSEDERIDSAIAETFSPV